MYHSLLYDFPVGMDDSYYDVDDGLSFDGVGNWAMGTPFEKAPPDPMIVRITAINGFLGGLPEMMDGNICLMTVGMVDVIKSAGVDNIDLYPAILRDEESGREFSYYAVNILGLVEAADLKKSEWINLDGDARLDTHFEKLVIDPRAARGQLMFRLAESTGTIVIHDRVKAKLEAGGFPTLKFEQVG